MLSLQEPSVSRCVFCAAPPDPCRGTSKTKNSAARQAPARPHEAASLSRGGRRKSPTQALTAIHFLLGLFSGALRDGGRGSNQPSPMWGWRRGKTTAGKRGAIQVRRSVDLKQRVNTKGNGRLQDLEKGVS